MSDKAARLTGPLADTHYDIDTREAPRYGCFGHSCVKLMVRPSFRPIAAVVRDLSIKGVGLMCEKPLQAGAQLALLWEFGPPESWRTLRGRVVRASPFPRGGWVMGIVFDERLGAADIDAFFGADQRSAWARHRG